MREDDGKFICDSCNTRGISNKNVSPPTCSWCKDRPIMRMVDEPEYSHGKKAKIMTTNTDLGQFILRAEDSKLTRLEKVRNFLIYLKEISPNHFKYSSFIATYVSPEARADYSDNVFFEKQTARKLTKYIVNTIHNGNPTDQTLHDALTTTEHGCGTCACVAGWVGVLDQTGTIKKNTAIDDLARNILGLTFRDSEFLFMGESGHNEPFIDLNNSKIDDAIHRIQILIDIEKDKEDPQE